MTQLVSDTFTYSDGDVSSVSSGAWYGSLGSPAVISGEVRETGSVGLGKYQTTAPPSADYYSEVKIGTVVSDASDNGVGPAVRVTVGGSAYFAQGNTVETKLYRVVDGGGYTQLGSDGAAVASNDVLRLECSGTGASISLVVKKNGTQIISVSDTDSARITAANSYGWWCSGGGTAPGRLDNFAGGDFNVAASTIMRQMMAHEGG